MPIAPPTACSRCGRPRPKGQACSCRTPWEGSTNPPSTRRWRILRASKLRHTPICEHIDPNPDTDGAGIRCNRLAVTVDHIQPLSENGPRWDWSNLQSLCGPHAQEKNTADAARGKARPR
jgi:5-methylcytosine-specific restriction enzyme A